MPVTADIHPDNAAQAEFWNGDAGRRWRDHQDRHDHMLRPVSKLLLAAAAARPGERVVDVGCGCGELAFRLAKQVAPDGQVLGVDISEPMLGVARERAPAGLGLSFALADATTYGFEPSAADLVLSRFGVMFFSDPAKSFANLWRALKPGGRTVFACWREAKKNLWAVTPLREAAKHAPPLPEMGPEDPGPFSFADDGRVRRILRDAGFTDIAAEPHDFPVDLALGGGIEFGCGDSAQHRSDKPDPRRSGRGGARAAAADIRKSFAAHAIGDRVLLDAAIWIVSARKPGG